MVIIAVHEIYNLRVLLGRILCPVYHVILKPRYLKKLKNSNKPKNLKKFKKTLGF